MGKVIPLFKPVTSAQSDVESQIDRDQWERPLILPVGHEPHPGCSPKKCGTAYRRASTVSEVLEDHFGLNEWKIRLTAEGLAQRPDLVQSIHGCTRKELRAICEEAFLAAGGDVAARNGSTMHRLTDRLDSGLDLSPGLPSNIVAMLEAYERTTARLTTLDSERFIVQDKIKVAGTYDRRLYDEVTGKTLIGDLKTGQNLSYLGLKTCSQVAVYAAGVHYSLDHEREDHGADHNLGVLIWLPWTDNPSEAICELRWLDLRSGRKAILEGKRVEEFRKMTTDQLMPRMH